MTTALLSAIYIAIFVAAAHVHGKLRPNDITPGDYWRTCILLLITTLFVSWSIGVLARYSASDHLLLVLGFFTLPAVWLMVESLGIAFRIFSKKGESPSFLSAGIALYAAMVMVDHFTFAAQGDIVYALIRLGVFVGSLVIVSVIIAPFRRLLARWLPSKWMDPWVSYNWTAFALVLMATTVAITLTRPHDFAFGLEYSLGRWASSTFYVLWAMLADSNLLFQ